jgi:hypothetical protein
MGEKSRNVPSEKCAKWKMQLMSHLDRFSHRIWPTLCSHVTLIVTNYHQPQPTGDDSDTMKGIAYYLITIQAHSAKPGRSDSKSMVSGSERAVCGIRPTQFYAGGLLTWPIYGFLQNLLGGKAYSQGTSCPALRLQLSILAPKSMIALYTSYGVTFENQGTALVKAIVFVSG